MNRIILMMRTAVRNEQKTERYCLSPDNNGCKGNTDKTAPPEISDDHKKPNRRNIEADIPKY
ncbi:hypothetical protein ACLBWQ_07785 [Chryseobacterium sp. M5A1_1a]